MPDVRALRLYKRKSRSQKLASAVRRIRAIEGQKWTNRAKLSFIRGPSLVRMKKIEAIIDPAALEAVKLHLAEAGIDGRLTITEVSGLEDLGRFYQMET